MKPSIRLFPLVLFATASLFVLKGLGIMRNGHYTVTEPTPTVIAGGGGAAAPSGGLADKLVNNRPPPKECAPLIGALANQKADDMLTEKLSEKRKELDARLKDVELREDLLKNAEKKLDDALALNNDGQGAGSKGLKPGQEKPTDQIRSLISMYDNMKAKDAAKIFDQLDMSIMAQLSLKLKPQKMAEIMAEMTPEVAKKLTTELAVQGNQQASAQRNTSDLPKIEGKERM